LIRRAAVPPCRRAWSIVSWPWLRCSGSGTHAAPPRPGRPRPLRELVMAVLTEGGAG
jgi:hypothetical protein